MNWESRFADRARLMQQSTVREFLKHAALPDIISFAGGLPDSDLLPVEETRSVVDKALATYGARMLQYGLTEGIQELRELIADRFRGIGATAENVLITTGSQQALDLIGRVLINDGAKVAVQNPSYLAALSVWRAYGATFLAGDERSPIGADGIDDAELIYCIPNFNNPTGESLNCSERGMLLQWALSSGVPLVEDDPYGDLRYDQSRKPPSFLELARDLIAPTVHVGTVSKVVAPGFRVGWVVAGRDLIAKLAVVKQSLDLHTSTFSQFVVWELLKTGIIDSALPRLRASYAAKRDALLNALQDEMPPSITWSRPAGGFFLLLRLPAGVPGCEVAKRARDAGVLVVPGREFHVRDGENTLRLCFSSVSCARVHAGVARLGRAITHFLK